MPEYSLLHLIAAALVGFITGRIVAAANDPGRKADPKQQPRREAASAETNRDRLPPHVRSAIAKLLADGRIIEAVRDVRAALGIGLKEAKDVVDLMREDPPSGGARLH
jgi:ribosomal protein L7/L12